MVSQTEADDGTDEKNTVQWQRDLRDDLLEHADVRDDDEQSAFLERALEVTVEHLAENHLEHDGGVRLGSPKPANYEAVAELLEGNVESVDVRANGSYHAPKVTVWLKEHPPLWANTATRKEFKFSQHREHYNGEPTLAVIDVRPF